MEIYILYITDNISEFNHFPIYRIQVGWVHYALLYPIIESFIGSINYFGVDLGVCYGWDFQFILCPLYHFCCVTQSSEDEALV